MKYIVLSNSNFGYKNNDEFWLNSMVSFYNKEILSYVKKYDDINIIHLGNLFNSKNINIKTLTIVQNLFFKLSEYSKIHFLIDKDDYIDSKENNVYNIFKNNSNIFVVDNNHVIGNDIIYYNKDIQDLDYSNVFTNVKNIDIEYKNIFSNKENVNSPYQLNKDDQQIGYYIVIDDKYKFIENKHNYKYIDYTINNDEDFDNFNNLNKHNFITLNIDNDYYLNNKYKIEIFLNKHSLYKINFLKTEEIEIKNIDKKFNYDIDYYLDDYFKDDELNEEYENIKNILKNKI